jgi:hypothetical protein
MRLSPLHTASGSELDKTSKRPMVSTNNGKMAYVIKKIIPPIRPLSSILVKDIRDRQEGEPIPNANPHHINNTAIPRSPNVGMIRENMDEITPSRVQRSKKCILETLSAIRGPIRKDIIVVAGSNHICGRSQAMEKSIVKNHVIELKIKKKIKKKCLGPIENPQNRDSFSILSLVSPQNGNL